MIKMDYHFNFNSSSDEVKSIFTNANDSPATVTATFATTENFVPPATDNRNVGPNVAAQGSSFSALAPPFHSRYSMVTPQEPRVADIAPTNEEILMNIRANNPDAFSDDRGEINPANYYMGSRTETASTPSSGCAWRTEARNNEMMDFEFFIRTMTSANAFASMLTREQVLVLQAFRPSLLFEFLHEVARIRNEKRMQRAMSNECAFCKNNGENEENSAHPLKDNRGRVRCPVLRAFRCPRCGATGDRAHTIKYCPASYGSERPAPSLHRSMSSSSFLLSEGSRAGYAASSAQAQSPSASSAYSNPPFWNNFGSN